VIEVEKLLIANRGEIVVRIISTARRMGIKTVAVYSDADADALFVRMADEAHHIGPAAPQKSYLNIDSIMDAVKKSGADAVHPGYGFLSENAEFAEAVVSEGITFVGVSADILSRIESKSYCRQLADSVGVPVVPGTIDMVTNTEEIRDYLNEHGGPFLLKLDKGGGGQGIQTINSEDEIENVLKASRSLGQAAFGSPDCYIEKRLKNTRHIEIQFIGDNFGNYIILGERECSIQRRYQKVIEEAPSSVVTEKVREKLYDWSLRILRKMGYRNAGTIEYLRSEEGNFYFMELNARIQVEHPVTEFITNIDIVENQIDIASGKQLEILQEDIQFKGHAIEARIYAEEPGTYLPSPGTISKFILPPIKKINTRFEHALEETAKISPYYDPLLLKVVVWGSTREKAIKRIKKRLGGITIEGIKTNIPTLQMVIGSPEFSKGDYHTESLMSILEKCEFDPEENRYRHI